MIDGLHAKALQSISLCVQQHAGPAPKRLTLGCRLREHISDEHPQAPSAELACVQAAPCHPYRTSITSLHTAGCSSSSSVMSLPEFIWHACFQAFARSKAWESLIWRRIIAGHFVLHCCTLEPNLQAKPVLSSFLLMLALRRRSQVQDACTGRSSLQPWLAVMLVCCVMVCPELKVHLLKVSFCWPDVWMVTTVHDHYNKGPAGNPFYSKKAQVMSMPL